MSRQKKPSPNQGRRETHEDFVRKLESPAEEGVTYIVLDEQVSKIEMTDPAQIDKSSFQFDFCEANQPFTPKLEESKQYSGTMQSESMINSYDTLFKMREEYIFVFSGFNERFLTSVEVFDVTRGIWREFQGLCSHRTKFNAV